MVLRVSGRGVTTRYIPSSPITAKYVVLLASEDEAVTKKIARPMRHTGTRECILTNLARRSDILAGTRLGSYLADS